MADGAMVGVRESDVLDVDIFYAYGLDSAPMLAIRAPFATTADGAGIVGRLIATPAGPRRVVAVARQTTAPIARGEPIGVEIRADETKPAAA